MERLALAIVMGGLTATVVILISGHIERIAQWVIRKIDRADQPLSYIDSFRKGRR